MSIAGDLTSARPGYRHAMDDTGRVLARAHELAQEFVAGLDERPVWPRSTFEEMLGGRLLADGTCVVTPAIWGGRAVQRCAVSNWSTSEADVTATVDAVRRVVAAM
jgi:hypothetical protein